MSGKHSVYFCKRLIIYVDCKTGIRFGTPVYLCTFEARLWRKDKMCAQALMLERYRQEYWTVQSEHVEQKQIGNFAPSYRDSPLKKLIFETTLGHNELKVDNFGQSEF